MAQNFAIMRCEKLKSAKDLQGSLAHCFREQDTPNADPEKTKQNINFDHKSVNDAMRAFKDMTKGVKLRSNGVVAVEYVFTASPEWFENATDTQKNAFFEGSLDWLREKYGKDNLLVSTVHNDETTPHLSAFVVPLVEKFDKKQNKTLKKLSARDFIGGKREQLAKDQTSFFEKVAHLGLSRGIEGSKASHVEVSNYYKRLKQPTENITIEDFKPRSKGFLFVESKQEVAERIIKKSNSLVAKAQEYTNTKARVLQLEKVATKQQSELKELNKGFAKIFGGLTEDQMDQVISMARQFRELNRVRKEQERLKMNEREKTKGKSR